jgi:hypothetical protein
MVLEGRTADQRSPGKYIILTLSINATGDDGAAARFSLAALALVQSLRLRHGGNPCLVHCLRRR